MRPNWTERVCSLFFTVVFLMAAQGQALGLRHCSLHDALPEPASTPASESHAVGSVHGLSTALGSAHHDHGHGAEEGPHSGGPAGCMDDCHVGSTTVAFGVGGEMSVPPFRAASGPVAASDALEGPRHVSYELHLPNAPPPSA